MGRCTQIKTHAWSNASVVLAGNKCDLEESRVVNQSRGQDLAQDLGTAALWPLALLDFMSSVAYYHR